MIIVILLYFLTGFIFAIADRKFLLVSVKDILFEDNECISKNTICFYMFVAIMFTMFAWPYIIYNILKERVMTYAWQKEEKEGF